MNDHAVGVNIVGLEVDHFCCPEPSAVSDHQHRPMFGGGCRGQQTLDFLPAERLGNFTTGFTIDVQIKVSSAEHVQGLLDGLSVGSGSEILVVGNTNRSCRRRAELFFELYRELSLMGVRLL